MNTLVAPKTTTLAKAMTFASDSIAPQGFSGHVAKVETELGFHSFTYTVTAPTGKVIGTLNTGGHSFRFAVVSFDSYRNEWQVSFHEAKHAVTVELNWKREHNSFPVSYVVPFVWTSDNAPMINRYIRDKHPIIVRG